MNQQTYQEFIHQVRGSIENYKKNVIDQKYQNDIAELQKLLGDLNQQTFNFFKENQRNMTPEVIERISSEIQESKDYINLIANETERFIKMDKDLNSSDVNMLLAQNTFIKNLSLRDEVQMHMDYYEKASKKSYTTILKQQGPRAIERAFTNCTNAEGRTKLIQNEFATEYQKLSDMKANLNKVLQNDRKKMQSLYNAQARNMPAVSLGEITVPSIRPEYLILSDEEIKRRAQGVLAAIQKLDRYQGMKTKYQFTFEGKVYVVMIPLGKDPYFRRSLEELASYRDILKDRIKMEQDQQNKKTDDSSKQEEYENIQIDYNLLKGCTVRQKISYLQTIMLRIEGIKSLYTMEVEDLKGNIKTIPSYYYDVYQECIDMIWELDLQVDPEYVDSLTDLQKVGFYERLMERIELITQRPFAVIDGKNISAKYAKDYISAKEALTNLRSKNPFYDSTVNPARIGVNTALDEYYIDETYVATLNDNQKLSYYSNLIAKSATCPMEPKVSYAVFGMPLTISAGLLTTVQECERKMQEYIAKNDLIINEAEVSARTPEMQFAYYGRLLEKMKFSKKGPKTKVEAFGESFEIPYECLDTFHEVLKRMEDLKKQFAVQPKKTHKVKAVRKPRTSKVKDFFKKLSNRTKIALAVAATAITTSVVGFFSGYYFGQAMPKAVPVQETIQQGNEKILGNLVNSATIDPSISAQIDQNLDHTSQVSREDSKIDEFVRAAKQSMASKFGSTFTLKNAIGYISPDDPNPKAINSDFVHETYTVTSVVVEMPEGGLAEFDYRSAQSQEQANEVLQQGGEVVRVAGVAQKGEQDFSQNGKATAYFDLDNVNMVDYANRSTTNLSQQIMEQLNQAKEMGR